MAAALLALFREREQTTRMAAMARQHVLERHQASRLIGDIDRLYLQLLDDAGLNHSGKRGGTTW
jgi:hypothetical protein